MIREGFQPLIMPNGIGRSPHGDRLYVAETWSGRLWAFAPSGPGEIRPEPWPSPNGGALVAALPELGMLESLALDSAGNICFGGADLKTAYITQSSSGRLVTTDWPRPSLALHRLDT